MKENNSKPLQSLLFTALFAALTAVGAFIKIPVGYTSITLQVLFILASGMLLGPYYGALSQVLYLMIGLIGLPVFTGGGGFTYVLQPGFGFLLGGIPAAFLTGLLSRRRKTFLGFASAGAVGIAAIYLVGLPYLYGIVRLYLGAELSVPKALVNYCLLFLPFDTGKLVLSAFLCRRIRKALPR